MLWDDLEELRLYVKRVVKELSEELERELREWGAPEEKEELQEPLHTVFELPEKYVVVLDLPACDEAKAEVLIYEDKLEVKAKVKTGLALRGPGFGERILRLEEYRKVLPLPRDADPSKASYKFTCGRLVVEVPKRRR